MKLGPKEGGKESDVKELANALGREIRKRNMRYVDLDISNINGLQGIGEAAFPP